MILWGIPSFFAYQPTLGSMLSYISYGLLLVYYFFSTKGKLLIIDVDNLDFVDKPEDLGYVIDRIDSQINGLF